LAWLPLAVPAAGLSLRSRESALRGLLTSASELQPAAQEFEAALEHHPVDYGLHVLAGVFYTRFGNAHGLRHLNLAMLLNPASPAPHLVAAGALAATGRGDQAALEYRASFELGWPMYDRQLREVVDRCGPQASAKNAMPDDPMSRLTLAQFFEREKDPSGMR